MDLNVKVTHALDQVRTILDQTRDPKLPANLPHAYDDKFELVESATRATVASALGMLLQGMNLTRERVAELRERAEAGRRALTLEFQCGQTCAFVRTEERDVEAPTSVVRQQQGGLFAGTTTVKTVTKVTEHFWRLGNSWDVLVYIGTGDEDGEKISLCSRTETRYEIKTKSEVTPYPEQSAPYKVSVDIGFLINALDPAADHRVQFRIDRSDPKKCHTPRRNPDVDEILKKFGKLREWAEMVNTHLQRTVYKMLTPPDYQELDMNKKIESALERVFTPTLALFSLEETKEGAEDASPTVRTLAGDMDAFLNEQNRTLTASLSDLQASLPSSEDIEKLVTGAEARLHCVVRLLAALTKDHKLVVDGVEDMLRSQLISAIGKEIGPVEFAEYMMFHNRRMFRPECCPRDFCYAVRRSPEHFPEGTVSIEMSGQGAGKFEPIQTTVKGVPATAPMRFALSAAAEVSFTGTRLVHGFVHQQFSGRASGGLQLACRARQFSSFILLAGTIVSVDEFRPSAALIIKNRDDLKIPLLLETIPTPKEFRDAIESLSPEQQRFCKAFRAMQLASTLFGICIIQIKPQLEKLLRLPTGSLTKEIQLTEDLVELFTKYQIPSDLISFDGDEEDLPELKLGAVKGHVKMLQDMLAKSKEKELAEEREVKLKMHMGKHVMGSTSSERVRDGDGGGGGDGWRGRGPPQPKFRSVAPMASMPLAPPPPGASEVPKSRSAAAPEMERGSAGVVPSPQSASMSVAQVSNQSLSVVDIKETATGNVSVDQGKETTEAESDQGQPADSEGQGQGGSAAYLDFTALPSILDRRFDELDEDAALRPTKIQLGTAWEMSSQDGLLSAPKSRTLYGEQQGQEKAKAYDLLDALSRSGTLSIDCASLHVMLAATHCFDQTLINTVVQGNVNPIEKVERSSLIVASTIQNASADQLITQKDAARIALHSPRLFHSEATALPPIEHSNQE